MNAKKIISVVNKTNEFKLSKSDVERSHIKQLLAQNFPIKVIQSVISTVT